ncbi:MAG TPA: sulfurtransferase [Sphingobacteriaceae bacterium]
MSQEKPYPLINPEELLALAGTGNLVLTDAGTAERYGQSHLQGAVHVNLETDLAAIGDDAAEGGRHPLPAPADFARVLGNLGITPGTLVVVYDDKQGSNAAARFWWMLRAIGHTDVRVLNGGLQAAVKAGFPVESQAAAPAMKPPYPVSEWSLPLADISLVDRASSDPAYLIIDVRDENRYKGRTEPIDLVAGHIPGAVNIPFTSNLDPEGRFLPAETLKEKYQEVFRQAQAGNVIVHCGSGVTACHTLLAAASAGLEIPRLYVGSWSEWSRTGRQIIREE